jgi:PAS domain S-box-containing protein
LKQTAEVSEIPVIFTTASIELADKLKGFHVGGADYITKPFQFEEVLARVKTHLTLRRLRRELRAEKERFKGLSNAAFEGILLCDQGRVVEVNQTLERMFGYSREEFLELGARGLLMPEFGQILDELLNSETERAHEALARRKDGSTIFLEAQSRSIIYQGGRVRVVAMRDISWRKTLERQAKKLASENVILKASLSDRDHLGELIGRGPAMQKVYERILKTAVSDAPVIISGETGAGKELAARTICQLGDNHGRIFLPVNCAALQEPLFESQFFGYRKGAFTGATQDEPGYFDQARGGVLFLDEISELTPVMQAKLLRVLNNGEYTPVGATKSRMADVRIMAATNQPLRPLVAAGRFREDLFHRLNVIALEMPPLRQHKEDLPLLAAHFLRRAAPDAGAGKPLPDEVLARFKEYNWPGNVRELANEVQRYVTMEEVDLRSPDSCAAEPERSADGQTFNAQIEAFERRVIAGALASVNGSRTRASELLQIPPATLYRKIQKYGL